MSLTGTFIAAAVALAFAVSAHAGTMFRLEIGPPVAAGFTKSKNLKKFDKKVVLAVRALVCEDMANVQITGTAEGVVNGSRRSVPLTLAAVDKAAAIYAVQYEWPDTGAWVLHLKGACAKPNAEASTLVPMSKGAFIREKTQVLTEAATKKQIEDAVSALSRTQS
jgi:hypothetical protein